VVVDRIGDEHPAGIGQGFDPGGDVDAVAIEVVALDDHIAEIDADAQFDAFVYLDGIARSSFGTASSKRRLRKCAMPRTCVFRSDPSRNTSNRETARRRIPLAP
jgi:hypothetical protein